MFELIQERDPLNGCNVQNLLNSQINWKFIIKLSRDCVWKSQTLQPEERRHNFPVNILFLDSLNYQVILFVWPCNQSQDKYQDAATFGSAFKKLQKTNANLQCVWTETLERVMILLGKYWCVQRKIVIVKLFVSVCQETAKTGSKWHKLHWNSFRHVWSCFPASFIKFGWGK